MASYVCMYVVIFISHLVHVLQEWKKWFNSNLVFVFIIELSIASHTLCMTCTNGLSITLFILNIKKDLKTYIAFRFYMAPQFPTDNPYFFMVKQFRTINH